MLDLPLQRRFRLCDGPARRDFMRVGALGVGGLTLADLLRLRAQGGATGDQRRQVVIMVLLRGGPSHIDTLDPNPRSIQGGEHVVHVQKNAHAAHRGHGM